MELEGGRRPQCDSAVEVPPRPQVVGRVAGGGHRLCSDPMATWRSCDWLRLRVIQTIIAQSMSSTCWGRLILTNNCLSSLPTYIMGFYNVASGNS
jgi:hypothetical protein